MIYWYVRRWSLINCNLDSVHLAVAFPNFYRSPQHFMHISKNNFKVERMYNLIFMIMNLNLNLRYTKAETFDFCLHNKPSIVWG